MRDRDSSAVARLEEAVRHVEGRVQELGEELKVLREGVINKLVWALLVLALALGGKDVLQAVI